MKGIFVIHKDIDGKIISSGRIDREFESQNPNDATVEKAIVRILSKYSNCSVVYLTRYELPDETKEKILDGEIAPFSESDIAEVQAIEDEQEAVIVEIETKLQMIAGKNHNDLDSYLNSNNIDNNALRMLFHVVLALVHKENKDLIES